ncbi:hypothetical protein AB0J35_30720 [Nonomuraea angiospora]|uniref:hypothetical protein n=1 Tax=Nonomuraea angiospora TaxID=46172 RepID=UPI003437B89C
MLRRSSPCIAPPTPRCRPIHARRSATNTAPSAGCGAYVLAEHLSRTDTIDTALERYEQALRPVVTDKQQVARNGTSWFIPATARQLRLRRAALKLARLPVIDRYVAGALVGKSTAIITNLRTTGSQVSGFSRR